MLRSVRLRIYVYAHLNMRYIDYKSMASYEIWQVCVCAVNNDKIHYASIPLKCGTSCLSIKLKLGRVGMGRVLHLRPSWHGPSFMWAELARAELVLGRVVLHPNGPVTLNRLGLSLRFIAT